MSHYFNQTADAYLRDFIVRTMASRADLIVWNFWKLPLHLLAPYRPHPWILFPVHETNRNVVFSASKHSKTKKDLRL